MPEPTVLINLGPYSQAQRNADGAHHQHPERIAAVADTAPVTASLIAASGPTALATSLAPCAKLGRCC